MSKGRHPGKPPLKRSPAKLINSPRALALNILEATTPSTAKDRLAASPSTESLLHQTLARHAALSRPDRALLLELVQGVRRWQLRLDYIITQISSRPLKKLHPLVLQLLRLTAYQILFLDRIPPAAAVNEAVRLAKSRHLPPALVSFVNATLRSMAAVGKTIPLPDPQADPVQALAVGASHPPWLVRRYLSMLKEEGARQRCAANNRIPPLTIRVNNSKISPADLIKLLAQEGVEAQPGRFSPLGLIITSLDRPPLSLASYQQGLWLFQDEAAQLVTYLLQVGPGQRILEIGAGRGGKTTHVAQLLGGRGQMVALDQSHWRLAELGHNVTRLGLPGVSSVAADATQPLPFQPTWRFDRILIDAPCSGLGIIRRHPELRWRRQAEDVDRFSERQLALLRQAAPWVRPGGLVLYVTCSTAPEENDAVVEAFLATAPGFHLSASDLGLPEAARPLLEPGGYFRTLPERDDLDGFFAAALVRD